MTTTISRIKEVGWTAAYLAAHYLGEPAVWAGRAWQWFCPFHQASGNAQLDGLPGLAIAASAAACMATTSG